MATAKASKTLGKNECPNKPQLPLCFTSIFKTTLVPSGYIFLSWGWQSLFYEIVCINIRISL